MPRLHALTRRAGLASLALLLGLSSAFAEDRAIDASRIVSIGGDVTEIIYALGEEKRLVGRDSTSLFPEQALALPDVGYMRQLSPEGVMATNPSLILATEGSGPPETLAVLANAKVRLETVPERYDAAGIAAKITQVGALIGVPDKAAALNRQVEADLAAAIADAARRPESERKRVLFILSLQGGKVMAAGGATAADAIIGLSGAVNAAAGFQGYKPMSDEAIITAKPEVVLMMTRGGSHAAGDGDLFAHPALALTPAAKSRSFIRMDGLQLLGFGPRTAAAVRSLHAAIYAAAPGK